MGGCLSNGGWVERKNVIAAHFYGRISRGGEKWAIANTTLHAASSTSSSNINRAAASSSSSKQQHPALMIACQQQHPPQQWHTYTHRDTREQGVTRKHNRISVASTLQPKAPPPLPTTKSCQKQGSEGKHGKNGERKRSPATKRALQEFNNRESVPLPVL